MKKLIVAISILVLSIPTLSSQTVDEIVTKHLNAIGGMAKLHEVKSVQMESSVKIQALDIENVTSILLGKALKSESKIMGNSLVQAFDGTTAWEITPIMMGGSGEPKIMSEEAAKNIFNQIDPFPLLDYAQKGTKIELLAAEKVDDKDAYHLKVSPKKGAESEIWIDVTSGLIAKIKTVQNGQEVEMVFSKHTEIEGVNFAMKMEISNPMAGVITIETKNVMLNTEIDEQIFQMPNVKK